MRMVIGSLLAVGLIANHFSKHPWETAGVAALGIAVLYAWHRRDVFSRRKPASRPAPPAPTAESRTKDQGPAVLIHPTSETYQVDPFGLSCSCLDWRRRRASFSREDPRRLCKHLTALAADGKLLLPPAAEVHRPAILACARRDWGFFLGGLARLVVDGEGVAFYGADKSTEWLNVVTGGELYGFNVDERRWSYNKKPRNHAAIEEAMLGRSEALAP